jgi:protein-S-isoprenylcysteine O-methyltransferase Ste14
MIPGALNANLRERKCIIGGVIDPKWFSGPVQGSLFIGSFYIWFAFELVNILVVGRHRKGGRRQDRGSVWGILIMIYAAIALIFVTRRLGWGVLPGSMQWIGLGLIWAGVLVREWAILSLGRAFTSMVETNPGQALVRSGPYRRVRHPAYTGSMLTLCGFGLAAGSWVGALLAVAIAVAGYSYRVQVEERALLEAFGEEYREYMSQSGRFLPRKF